MSNESFSMPIVNAEKADLLYGEDYLAIVLSSIERARSKAWGSFFIMSLTSETSHVERIKEIADALVRAKNRGVDVRMILSKFESGDQDFNINLVALTYLKERGVPARQYLSSYRSSNHCKDWIFDDDWQISGSGNLTSGGLFNNMESALAIQSGALNEILSKRYLGIWKGSLLIETPETHGNNSI